MATSTNDIRDDIAFLKSLAADGAAPVMGGAPLALAGLCFAAASIAHWAALSGYLPLSGWGFAIIWFAALAVFLAGIAWSRRGHSRTPSPATRAINAVWTGVAWAILAIFASLIAASMATGEWILMSLISPVVLALYGAAWMVGARFATRAWMSAMPYMCFAAAIAIAALTGRAEQYLGYAAALLLTAALPGFALMRKGPA